MDKKKVNQIFQENVVVVFLIALCIFFGVANNNFFSSTNVINLTSQMCINALLASGLTYVIILGGIDISVGSQFALAGVAAATIGIKFFPNMGYGTALLVLIGTALVMGLITGLIIGFFIAYLNVVPMICTLAMLSVLRGVAYIFTGGGPVTGLPTTFACLGAKRLIVTESFPNGMIPTNVIFTVIVVLLMHLLLTKTVYGRHVFAVGSNKTVAHLAGINVKRVILVAHTLCAITACMAGVVTCSKLQNGQPNTGEGYEMFAIASTVLGGTSLAGGRGSVARAMFGVAIIAVINNGMNLLNISAYWQKVVIGAIILLAVALDMAQQQRKKA